MGSLLKSTLNTRALPIGGMRYIRSDFPADLTVQEVRWLLENDITTLVDLRTAQESEKAPCPLRQAVGFTYHHLPVTGGGATPKSRKQLYEIYRGMVDKQMDAILDTILSAKSNVMFFCTAGKDRTGVVSALLLKRLGASEDIIIEDYMRSKDNLKNMLDGYVTAHPETDIDIITPREENIKAVLSF